MALTRGGATGVLDVQDPAWDHLDVLLEVRLQPIHSIPRICYLYNLCSSPRITGLSQSGFFGYHIPVSVPTCTSIYFIFPPRTMYF
jgi:hypothetical protein